MRFLIVVLALMGCLSMPASADDPVSIVRYWFANRDYGSYFEIYADGTIKHEERSPGSAVWDPPKIDKIKETPLTQDEVKDLQKKISEASRGRQEFERGRPQYRDSFYGRFEVKYGFNLINIWTFETPWDRGGYDRLTVNRSDAAGDIFRQVMAYPIHFKMK